MLALAIRGRSMRLFDAGAATAAKGVHLALVAESRAAVDAFYAAAVAATVDSYTLRGLGVGIAPTARS